MRRDEIGSQKIDFFFDFLKFDFDWSIILKSKHRSLSPLYTIRKLKFLPNKILMAKMRQTCCCTLFVVCRQFSRGRQFFFDEKVLCVCRRDRYPDTNPAYSVQQKTCLRNMVNVFYILFAVHRFFVVLPLFCSCSWIVYSGLYA